jgi:hypothetical protein
MTLYREFPKQSIMTELRTKFSAEELDVVRLDLFDLMNTCHTMEELNVAIAKIIEQRTGNDFTYIHQGYIS